MARFFHGAVVGVVVTVTLTGTAFAATGGSFVLGRSNSAGAQTLLTNTGAGPVLALSTRAGQPPLAVSGHAGKATHLNADRLDGLDGSSLQRRVAAQCPDGTAITVIGANGSTRCEGTAYDGAMADVLTDADGIASVACPGAGGIATTGGWTLPDGVVAVANGQSLYADDSGEEGYNVRMLELDGSPYRGALSLSVQCEYPGAAVTSGALRRAPDQAKPHRY